MQFCFWNDYNLVHASYRCAFALVSFRENAWNNVMMIIQCLLVKFLIFDVRAECRQTVSIISIFEVYFKRFFIEAITAELYRAPLKLSEGFMMYIYSSKQGFVLACGDGTCMNTYHREQLDLDLLCTSLLHWPELLISIYHYIKHCWRTKISSQGCT